MHIALLLELPRTSAFLLAQPVSLKDNLFSSISAITSDPLQLPHSCLFHNFQFCEFASKKKTSFCVSGWIACPSWQERQLHLAQLKAVMDTGQKIQDQFRRWFINHLIQIVSFCQKWCSSPPSQHETELPSSPSLAPGWWLCSNMANQISLPSSSSVFSRTIFHLDQWTDWWKGSLCAIFFLKQSSILIWDWIVRNQVSGQH